MSLVAAGTRILAWRVVQKASNALAVLLVAKELGPLGQGHYALTTTIALVLAALLNGGVGLAAVPSLRGGTVAPRRALRAQAAWTLAVAVVLAALAAATLATADRELLAARLGWGPGLVAAAAVVVLAGVSFDIHAYDLLAAGRLVAGALVGALRAAAYFAIIGGLALAGRLDLFAAVVAFAAVHAAAALALAVIAWRLVPRMAADGPPPAGPGAVTQAGRFARQGWLGQLSGLSYLLLLRADQGFLEAAHGAAAVGIYSVAVWAAELLWLLPEAINPLLVHSSADARHPAARDAVAARAVRVSLLLTAVGAALLALIARPLFGLVLGGAYAASVPALLALLPGTVLLAPGAVLAGDFIGRGRPTWNTQASVVTMAVNVVLCLAWVPPLGAVGAGLASSLAYGIGSALMIGQFCRATRMSPRRFWLGR